jgi:hypothetical protein
MSTKNTNSSRRRMTAAALMVAAAGALAVGGVGAAATANAKPIIDNPGPAPSVPRSPDTGAGESFAAIAFSPATGTWASFTNAPSLIDATAGAVSACHNAGGGLCLPTGSTKATGTGASCVALAVDPVHWVLWHSGVGPTQISAMTAALDGKDRRIATTTCTTVNGQPNLSFTGKVNQLAGT